MKALKIILIIVAVLIYLAAVVLYPIPVLGSTIVALLLWFMIWSNRERAREQEEKERDRQLSVPGG